MFSIASNEQRPAQGRALIDYQVPNGIELNGT